ncbi:MAG TPA: hypothetical protein VKR21_10720 [Solirubrobacteraceae bacterium]|nr:hypothetical protein [Solirubrobacteraceae bacterium]
MLKRIVVAGVAVALLAGCGSSSSSGTGTVSLTRAAYVSSRANGYRALISLRENIPNAGVMTMNATGSFSVPARAGSMTMHMNIPSAEAAQAGLGTLQMQAVFTGQTFYMKLPAAIASKVPGGKPWWKFNLDEAGKLAGIPGLSSLMSGSSSVNNPGQYLDFLRATASGSVKTVGQATVDGVRTTHYRAAIDLNKLPRAVPASDRAGVEQLIAALRSHGELVRRLPIDVWIDSSNLIRRYEMTYSQPLGTGTAAKVAMRADFVDYGPQPAPQIPPKSQTLDLLALLQQQGF